MNIEQLAVDAIKHSLALTDYSKDYINTGEKMPSWDGDILVFKTSKYSKDNIRKIPVQVKGLQHSDLSKNTIKYYVEKRDLINYYNDGGVIYFVVYIDEAGIKNKIYYKELLPIFINEKLSQSNNEENTIGIELNTFPDNESDKMNLFYDFINNREKQFSSINQKLPTFDDFENNDNITYSFTFTDYDGTLLTHPEKLLNKDVYLYALDKNTNMKTPMASTITIRSTARKFNIPISVGKTEYYSNYLAVNNGKTNTIQIGNMFSVVSPINNDQDKDIKCNIKIKGTLSQRIKDLAFIMDMKNHSSYNIGQITIPFKLKEEDEKSFNELEIQKTLKFYQDAKKVLDMLNVKKDLELDNISQNDLNKLACLIDCFVNNNYLKNIPKNTPFQSSMKISNISITLLCLVNVENQNEYIFKSAFDHDIVAYIFDQENEENKAPAICNLNKNNFLHDDNIDYEFIVERIKHFKATPFLILCVNKLMLEMLMAYDENHNEQLYSCIEKLSQFLCENDKEDSNISTINAYQIKKRKQTLSAEELQNIENILTTTDNNQLKIACYILLDSIPLAKIMIEKLPDEEKQEFTKYPICNLLNNKEINNG